MYTACSPQWNLIRVIEHYLGLFCSELISSAYLSDLHLYTPSQQLCSSADTWLFRIPSFCINQVVSALSLTKLQQHGTSFPLLSVTHPLSVPSNLPWKPFSFRKLFLQSPCPEVLVCIKVCACVCVCVYVCIYIFGHQKFKYTNSKHMHARSHTHTGTHPHAHTQTHTLTHTSTSGKVDWRKRFRKEKGFQGKFDGTDRGCVTNRSGEFVPCCWSLVRERSLTTWLCAKGWYSENSGVCRRTELPRRSVKVKKIWGVSRGRTIQRFKAKWSEFEIQPLKNEEIFQCLWSPDT